MNNRAKLVAVFASTMLVSMLLVGAVVGRSAPPDEPYKHLAVFTEVIQRIKSQYVEEPDMKSVTLGAVNGLLESLDPFASYLNAEQYKDYTKKNGAYKGDIGLLLSKRSGFIGIVGAVPGSPAANAGLGAGDWIESIKGVATRDMPLAYAEMMLRGEPGTSIELSIFRARRPEPQKTTLNRTVITYPAVFSEILSNQVGYIRPGTLAPGKVKEIGSTVEKLEKQGAKKILLDLRNVAVGTPEDGVELANLFLDRGLIGYSMGQKSTKQEFQADPGKVKTKLPLQVITNRGTANGAEVAAAALLDSKRAEVAGERTYGSASIKKAVPLDDGGAIILSVAKYYSPSGKSIPDNGVTPGTIVTEPESQVEYDEDGNPLPQDPNAKDPTKEGDRYLDRILTILKDK